MRIIGGKLSGRKIEPPVSRTTRPMMDRVRQALFNILEHHDWGREIGNVLDGTRVLDAFCGTGALAFEALSHGAAYATLFDTDSRARDIAKKNAESLGVTKKCVIMPDDATTPPRAQKPCELIFLCPPYRKGLIPPAMLALDKAGWFARNVFIVAETAKKEALDLPADFNLVYARFYGDTALHFVARKPAKV